MAGENFYTQKGYELNNHGNLTSSMEDYVEMIFRLSHQSEVVRINELAQNLNVKPSSASKMAQTLKALGYVTSEKYGYLKLTEAGVELGQYLIYRHNVLHEFLCLVNGSESELTQVEKIEHFFDRQTVDNLKKLTAELNMRSRESL